VRRTRTDRPGIRIARDQTREGIDSLQPFNAEHKKTTISISLRTTLKFQTGSVKEAIKSPLFEAAKGVATEVGAITLKVEAASKPKFSDTAVNFHPPSTGFRAVVDTARGVMAGSRVQHDVSYRLSLSLGARSGGCHQLSIPRAPALR